MQELSSGKGFSKPRDLAVSIPAVSGTKHGDHLLGDAQCGVPLQENHDLIRMLLKSDEGCIRIIREVDPKLMIDNCDPRRAPPVDVAIESIIRRNETPPPGVFEFFTELLETPAIETASCARGLAKWAPAVSSAQRDNAQLALVGCIVRSDFKAFDVTMSAEKIQSCAGMEHLCDLLCQKFLSVQAGKAAKGPDYFDGAYYALRLLMDKDPASGTDFILQMLNSSYTKVREFGVATIDLLPPHLARQEASRAVLNNTGLDFARKYCVTYGAVRETIDGLCARLAEHKTERRWNFPSIVAFLATSITGKQTRPRTQAAASIMYFAEHSPKEFTGKDIQLLGQELRDPANKEYLRRTISEALKVLARHRNDAQIQLEGMGVG